MFCPRGFKMPNHVLYVDDVMICYHASDSIVTTLMSLFHSYKNAYGQVINNDKSKF